MRNTNNNKWSLNCYAPGCGALTFVWVRNGKAEGRKVTKRDVMRFVHRTKDGKRLHNEGWRPFCQWKLWYLVKTCVRKDANTLLIDGHEYTYTITPFPERGDRKEVMDGELTVFCKSYNQTLRKVYGEQFEVKNWSLRAEIRYFLSHEEELYAYAWQQFVKGA